MSDRQDWTPCPDGLLHQMVQQRRQQQKRQSWERAAVPMLLVALVAIGFLFAGGGNSAVGVEKITCSEAFQRFADYDAGQLDVTESRELEKHFKDCPHCEQQFEERNREAQGTISSPAPLVAVAFGP